MKLMFEHEDCHVEPINRQVDRDALAKSDVAFLAVAGMGCPNCAIRVRNALFGVEGVLYVDVSLGLGMAAVAFQPEKVESGALLIAVISAGDRVGHHYRARLVETLSAAEAFTYIS